MSMPIIPPFAISASYQNSQMATGTYTQGGSQVFSHLVSPPSSGVASETASDNRAFAKGFSAYPNANEVQTVTVNGTPAGGTYKLQWGGGTTTAIAYNATAAQVQSALRALLQIPTTTAAVNEIQRITITGTPTGGTFTLTYSGQTTSALNWNATATEVQTALLALSNVGAGQLAVTGGPGPGTPFTVTFGGTLAGTNVAAITATPSLTGGTTPAVGISEVTPGSATVYSIAVSGSTGGPYTVTFSGKLGNKDVAPLSVTASALTGGTNPSVTITTTVRGEGAFYNQAKANSYQQFDGMRNQYDSAGGNHF
jgi:hypothetical protein